MGRGTSRRGEKREQGGGSSKQGKKRGRSQEYETRREEESKTKKTRSQDPILTDTYIIASIGYLIKKAFPQVIWSFLGGFISSEF